ncbi:uncharacterized protein LOC110683374 [Chenopodium quinoa]|uniref:uncharacterized protein LOC110683374 n=1 Tax=Chenopodium quinoa TaxID=63459 RepID=UPI000B774B43|nr:uncharacterized protein LOC110683374 [Chenopodium quinoa]
MALASRVAREKVATALQWRLPSNLLQTFNFSTESSSATATATTTTSEASKNTKRRKNKNLFEVAQFLPNWGLGYHMAKTHWTNVSYEITKINLYKDGRHGKAWGLAYKDGIPAPAPKKISGVHKRCWKYISNPLKVEAEPKPEAEAA